MDLNPCSILSAIPQRTFIIVSVNPALEPPDSAQAADKESGFGAFIQQSAKAADSSLWG
jgi:hypothetical protein